MNDGPVVSMVADSHVQPELENEGDYKETLTDIFSYVFVC